MRRHVASRSIGPALAIAVFGALLIAGIAALTLERISYERGEAVKEATRMNSNLVLAFEEHTLRSLRAADLALQLIAREVQRGGRNVSLAALVAEGALDARLFAELAVVDERGRVVLSAGPAPALGQHNDEILAELRQHSSRPVEAAREA